MGIVIGAVALATGVAVIGSAPAQAASPRVTITNEFGKAEADLTYSTTIHVEGTGFQSIQGGFGGIYVLFGWVSDPSGGSWRPSRGGATGEDYRYVPDSESKDNQGFQRFVSFPGSETEYAANGGLLDASGRWALDMVIPGPTFTAYDRSNDPVQVDCRVSTCGVITVGAHGVVNANNESFTPVTFADIYPADGAATPQDTTAAAPTTSSQTPGTTSSPPATSSTASPPTNQSSATATATAASTTSARSTGASTIPAGTGPSGGSPGAPGRLTVDRNTAVVGRVLAFSGQGFSPGEQVVIVLDDGLAAVGPLMVGADGSFAAVLALPPQVGVGTHVLRATGSGVGTAVEAAFPVRADDSPITSEAAAPPTAGAGAGPSSGAWIFLGASGGVLIVAVVALLVRLIRRHGSIGRREPTEGNRVSADGALA